MFSAIVVAGISLLLFLVSLLSFKRIKETKMLFIGIAFLLFFIKALAIIFEKFYVGHLILLDLLIIISLYIASVKK